MTSSPDLERPDQPVAPGGAVDRITTLDAVRGVAVLGILLINAVSFALPPGAYFNIETGGSSTTLDRIIGGLGEVLVDQKFMALFSMLFGAGIVLFADRAEAKGKRAGRLSLWRNALLFLIGLVLGAFWDGDVLVLYAICAPLLLGLRRQPPRALLVLGVGIVALSPIAALLAHASMDDPAAELGEYWFADGEPSDAVGLFFYTDVISRALGLMLIGVALHRTGVITGERPTAFYRRLAAWGLGVGLPLAALGHAMHALDDFSPDVALLGTLPNTLATIPVALGYLAVSALWDRRSEAPLHRRVRAVGRMALTNYLTQTALGLLLLDVAMGSTEPSRTAILGVVLGSWAIQLWWAPLWLRWFRSGPAEWVWRCATYRRIVPLRR